MSQLVTTHFVQQFSTNIGLLLQQKDSRFSGAVSTGMYTGKQASVIDQVGSVTVNTASTRYANLTPSDVPTDRRWVFPTDKYWSTMVDNFDKLRMVIDPQSTYTQAAVAAMNRAKDDLIVAAFWGDAKTGETGGTTTSFASGQQIAYNFGTNTGLTMAKLKEARRLLRAADIDPDEEMFIALTAKQEYDLLQEAQVISMDYNTKPVLVDGKVTEIMGFKVIHSERLVTDGTYRRIPVWCKSGMHLGMWKDINVNISQRNDKTSLPYQIYVEGTFGATRLEEKRVVEIKCAE